MLDQVANLRQIIGLHGLIGSGKDTVSQYLTYNYNFERITFASKLKDAVSVIFDLPRDSLEGITKEDRIWRETELEFWSKELGQKTTPRNLLQSIGTECIRNGLNQDIWVLLVKKKLIENSNINYVIPDVRLLNEIEMIKSLGGKVWSIERKVPEWWNDAVQFNNHIKTRGYETGLENPFKTKWTEVHYTEWALAGHVFDQYIKNDNDLNHLYQQVDKLITNS